MKNTGTTTWSAANNHKLGSQNPADNTTWGTSRATLAASVAPGAQYTFTYNVTAPATPGTHNFQWGMIREGTGWFGANTPNAAVNVTASANQPTLSVQRTPTPLVAGQNQTLQLEQHQSHQRHLQLHRQRHRIHRPAPHWQPVAPQPTPPAQPG